MLAVLPPYFCQAPKDSGATATPDHIALTWTGNPATTMTITWRTDSTVTSGVVQYQKGDKLSKKRDRQTPLRVILSRILALPGCLPRLLADLSPNAEYSYRVGDGEALERTEHVFDRPAGKRAHSNSLFSETVKALYGDSPYGIWRKTVHNAFIRPIQTLNSW